MKPITRQLNKTLMQASFSHPSRWLMEPQVKAEWLTRLHKAARDENLECRINRANGRWEIIAPAPEMVGLMKKGKCLPERAWIAILSIVDFDEEGKELRLPPGEQHIRHMQKWYGKSPAEITRIIEQDERDEKAAEARADRTRAEQFADEWWHPTMVAIGKDEHHTYDGAVMARHYGTRHKYIQGADLNG